MALKPPAGAAVAELIAEELGVNERPGLHLGVIFEEIKNLATGAVVGHEVLTRPAFSVTPMHWYEQGRALGLTPQLEARAIELALDVLPKGNTMITVNFSLDVLDTSPVRRVLRELSALRRPVAIELSEHHHTTGERLQETLRGLRNQGFMVAVDDAGTGDSDADFVRRVQPDIIKIDHTHTWALNYSHSQRTFVKRYLDVAVELNNSSPRPCQVVVEGVSSQFVAQAVRDLGQQYGMNLLGQGYWVTRTTTIDLRTPETATAGIARSGTSNR